MKRLSATVYANGIWLFLAANAMGLTAVTLALASATPLPPAASQAYVGDLVEGATDEQNDKCTNRCRRHGCSNYNSPCQTAPAMCPDVEVPQVPIDSTCGAMTPEVKCNRTAMNIGYNVCKNTGQIDTQAAHCAAGQQACVLRFECKWNFGCNLDADANNDGNPGDGIPRKKVVWVDQGTTSSATDPRNCPGDPAVSVSESKIRAACWKLPKP